MTTPVIPVILCGGSGTRLWPLSRGLYPKQFMDLGGATLFGRTLERATGLPGAAAPVVVCNEEHRFYAAAIMQEHGIAGHIILEPEPRNTAPAIALAAFQAMSEGDDPYLLVLPSDHSISPDGALGEALERALPLARQGYLGTFGLMPKGPEPGFGYILPGEALEGGFKIKAFVEKPGEERAAGLIAAGPCYWNSGMFIFKASVYLSELGKFSPETLEACRAAIDGRTTDRDFIRPDPKAFGGAVKDSIDYVVMERSALTCVTPFDADWTDLGSWTAFYDSAERDERGNAKIGDILAVDADNCYLHSTHRLLAVLGVSELTVVETADAVLVAAKERSQDVKTVLNILKEQKRMESESHVRVYRPWGAYEVLAGGERFQVKRIVVQPGQILSLQLHHHRAEHWVVVRGTARIVVGEESKLCSENQSIYIPLGSVHRLENPGKIPLEIVEIQSGPYLGEDDIVRLEDNYGR